MSLMEYQTIVRSKSFLGITLAIALLGLLALGADGPIIAIRKLDPSTGNIILETPENANTSGLNQKYKPGSFEPQRLVDEIWEPKVIPWVEENQVAFSDLISELEKSEQAAMKKYGFQSGGSTYNLLVSGEATVTSVSTSTPVGKVTIKILGSDQEAHLLAGPLVISTALRDTLPFLSLNNFTNQMQYADVAKALNDKALKTAYQDIEKGNLIGKKIRFTGAFAMSPGGQVNIVPTDVEVMP